MQSSAGCGFHSGIIRMRLMHTPSPQPPTPILPARESLSTKPLYWPPGFEGSRRCSLFNRLWYRSDSAAGTRPVC